LIVRQEKIERIKEIALGVEDLLADLFGLDDLPSIVRGKRAAERLGESGGKLNRSNAALAIAL
jgi:hypothetical protein